MNLKNIFRSRKKVAEKIWSASLWLLMPYFVTTMNAWSQTTGNVTDAPAMLNIGEGNGNISDFSMWLIRRLYKVDIDARMSQMLHDGKKSAHFIAAFNVEGSLVYNYETKGESISEWDDIGRNSGFMVANYRLEFNGDGTRRFTLNGLAWRNLNAIQRTPHAYESMYGNDPAPILKTVDRMGLLSLVWDEKSTFQNLRTFEIKIAEVGLRHALAGNSDGRNYLAVRGGADIGLWTGTYDQNTLPSILIEEGRSRSVKQFGANFYVGLEGRYQTPKGFRLIAQSTYEGGGGDALFTNRDNRIQNEKKSADYQAALDSFNSADAAWTEAKAAHEQTVGQSVSDADFAVIYQSPKPVKPADEARDVDTDATVRRNYGMLSNKIDMSKAITGTGRPKRIGASLEYNWRIVDRIWKYDQAPINQDMRQYFNPVFRAKVYFNF